jgi:hypothetical protein
MGGSPVCFHRRNSTVIPGFDFRADPSSNSKKTSPWFLFKDSASSEFVMHCKAIFELQLLRQRPCAIVTFGQPVAMTLGRLYPEELGRWNQRGFVFRDKDNGAAILDVTLGRCKLPLIVSIVHPSIWRPNVKLRKFRSLQGDAVERELF